MIIKGCVGWEQENSSLWGLSLSGRENFSGGRVEAYTSVEDGNKVYGVRIFWEGAMRVADVDVSLNTGTGRLTPHGSYSKAAVLGLKSCILDSGNPGDGRGEPFVVDKPLPEDVRGRLQLMLEKLEGEFPYGLYLRSRWKPLEGEKYDITDRELFWKCLTPPVAERFDQELERHDKELESRLFEAGGF